MTVISKTEEATEVLYGEQAGGGKAGLKSPNGQQPALRYGQVQEISYEQTTWQATVPAGTKLDQLLEPSYWRHYTRKLKPMNVVEAICEDGLWEASLRVMFVSTAEVKMAVRWRADHTAEDVSEIDSETHVIKWISPTKKFGVVRKDNGEVIKDELYPRSEALAFMKSHLQALRR